MFYGHITEELTNLVNLQYLDLAYNNMMGRIPKSIVNCKGMVARSDDPDNDYAFFGASYYNQGSTDGLEDDIITYIENFTVVTKGQDRLYTGENVYMVNLDLSCNNLIGDIPEEISTLVKLMNLNLSWKNS